MKTFGDALGYTGRFQTLIDAVHTEIAFDRLAGLGIPLGGSPGAGRNTGFAAHAELIFHENDTVRRSLLHCAGWTGRHAPGILAVEAGHKYVSHARQVVNFSGSDRYYLGQSRPDGQIVFGLAM